MTKNIAILIVFFILLINSSQAQNIDIKDYQRAVSYLWPNLNNKKIFDANVEPIWFKDSTGVAFILNDLNQKTYKKVIFSKNRIEPLFDPISFAKTLESISGKKLDPKNLSLQNITYLHNDTLSFRFENQLYKIDLKNYKARKVDEFVANFDEIISPKKKWIAYTDNYNIFVKSTSDGAITKLSSDGVRHYEYGSFYGWSDIMYGENGERPKRVSVNWSPDSKWIQTYIVDLSNAEKMYLLDWSIDTLYKPKLMSYYRGSPGDTNMVRMIPVFINIETGEKIIKDKLRSTHTNPIFYRWSKDSDIIFQQNNYRGYQKVELHKLNLKSKDEELLYQETSNTNIDNYQSILYEEIGKFLIVSEKDGWKQIYELDINSKALKPITNGEYYVNDILKFDTKDKTVLYTASGKETNQNPYHRYLYSIKLGEQPKLLTNEAANHDINLSPDGTWYFDNVSTLNNPTTTLLKNVFDQNKSIEISKAKYIDASIDIKSILPEPFTALGRDGKTTIFGAIWKPSNFDSKKKYPIIDQTYTGPHTFMYPRNFTSAFSRSNQALAELGFIVITVDGMGTANRSKAFHNVSYKNMGKNLEDHKLAILQLGRKYKWIDTLKVGIFGHSAGGYDSGHALLEYPDFYKVGVASSADHDFRMEKDWWPEMYMGWPIDSSYHYVSNITMAKNLKGKLLITHGGIDENVNPSATFKLAEALIKENKEFDMLILPSQKHGYNGIYNDYFTKKKWNYFVQHLLDLKPIWDFSLK